MSIFEKLNAINVNGKTEKKNDLTYLSWTWAWAEVKKAYPDAEYSIMKFNGLPYVYDDKTGYMVYTTVTIEGLTHEMWLPVMDSANKAMKAEPYTYINKWKQEKTCDAATMFDINKSIMRCLTKNLAMFGLGLYIYAGEDLPENEESTENGENTANESKPAKQTKPKEQKNAEQPKQQKNAEQPQQQEQIYFCEDCGKQVKAVGKYSAKQVAATNKERYGKIICGDCSKKMKMAGS